MNSSLYICKATGILRKENYANVLIERKFPKVHNANGNLLVQLGGNTSDWLLFRTTRWWFYFFWWPCGRQIILKLMIIALSQYTGIVLVYYSITLLLFITKLSVIDNYWDFFNFRNWLQNYIKQHGNNSPIIWTYLL